MKNASTCVILPNYHEWWPWAGEAGVFTQPTKASLWFIMTTKALVSLFMVSKRFKQNLLETSKSELHFCIKYCYIWYYMILYDSIYIYIYILLNISIAWRRISACPRFCSISSPASFLRATPKTKRTRWAYRNSAVDPTLAASHGGFWRLGWWRYLESSDMIRYDPIWHGTWW